MGWINGWINGFLLRGFMSDKKEDKIEEESNREIRNGLARHREIEEKMILNQMNKLFEEKEEISCSDIAKSLGVECCEITPVLNMLHRKGLVKKDCGYYVKVD